MKKIIFSLFCITYIAYAKNSVDLGSTVISNTSFKESLNNISTNVFSIDKTEIEEGGYSDITDVLKQIPSIQIQKIGGSSVVDIRGEGLRAKDTVKVLLNGIPLNYPITAPLDIQGNTELDSIPLDIIEKIEVLPSGGTILYGDNSSGGIINIITKKKLTKKYNAFVFSKYKNNDFTKGISLGYKLKKADFIINYNEIDKFKNFYFGKEDVKNFSSNLNYNFSKNTNLNFNYNRYESDKDILYPLTKEEFDKKLSSPKNPANYTVKKNGFNFALNHKFSDFLLFNFDMGYTDIVSHTDMDPATLLPIPNVKGSMAGRFTDKKLNLSPKLNFIINKNFDVTVGYAYEDVDAMRELNVNANGKLGFIKPVINMKQHFDLHKKSHSGFIKSKYILGDFVFTPGYRYEIIKTSLNHNGNINATNKNGRPLPSFFPIPTGEQFNKYSKTSHISTGEMGIVYNYRTTGKGYYNITIGETTPSINKYINSDLISGEVFKLNKSLKNEQYIKNEIGIMDIFFNSAVSFTIFDTRKKDELGMNGVVPLSWEYYNIDKTRRTGVEATALQSIGKFTLSQNITYIDSEIMESKISEEVGKKIPYVSDWNMNASIKYSFTENLFTTFSSSYKSKYRVGGRYDNGKLGGFPPSIKKTTGYYEDESKSSITCDLGLTYKYSGFIINMGVSNIFNENTIDSVNLVPTGNFATGTSTQTLYIPSVRRSYYIGFSYNF